MGKYKVCVYAICKNEEKFAKKWYESMSEADYVCVLDTGSNDNTVDILRELGARVESRVISPWRFDVARNLSMELIPDDTDICVCTDLDEVLLPGWRKKLEKNWEKDLNCLFYRYNWSLDKKNQPKVSFYLGNIHDRNHYQWTHPVHEVLSFLGENKEITITAKEGYKIKSVLVNDEEVKLNDNKLSLTNIDKNIIIKITSEEMPKTANEINNPKTGDNIVFYIIVSIISIVGLIIISKFKNKLEEK